MSALILKIVCAWCRTVLRDGSPGAPTSHGICAACQAGFEREIA